MDSLNDILNRVLQNAAETTAQRVVVATGKRPLRDPDSGSISHLQEAASALQNIRSASTAAAMAQRANYQQSPPVDDNNSGPDLADGESLSSPADRHRKTTLADDMNVLGTVGGAGTAVIQQIAAAGRAFNGIPEAANAFKDAVTEMANSAGGAAPVIDSVTGPLTKMASSIVSQISGIGKGGDPSAGTMQAGSSNSVDGAVNAAVRKILKAPKSFASWFGENDGTETAGASSGATGKSGSVQDWLNSSSIADSMRLMIGNVGHSLQSMTANVAGLMNGGLSAGSSASGAASGANASSLSGRIADSLDRSLARSWAMFRGMSAGSGGSSGASGSGGGGNNGGDDGDVNSQGNSGQGFLGGMKSQFRMRIGRAGQRIMARRFRRGIVSGRRLLRGGGGGGAAGGNAAGSGAGAGGGFFARMFGGGGAGAAAGGAGGGGAGAGAAAAGGGGAAAGAGIGAAGAILGVVAFVAVIWVAVDALMKLGRQGYETALRVAHLDGGLTSAKAQLDVSRLLRDIQTARTLSDAGANHMGAINRLEENLRPITDGAMLAGLHALTFGLNAVNTVFEAVRNSSIGVVQAFNQIEKGLGFDFINDNMVKALEDMKNGNNQLRQLEAAPLHNMFAQMPPAAPPRPPLPPLGGN